MKNLFLLISIFSLSLSFAQTGNKNTTTFGFKGGVNKSTINGTELDGKKTGYDGFELYASFFADTELNQRWNFENELLFSYTDDYHFIEIPIHVKYKFLKSWNVLIGPKLDFIVDDQNASSESNYRYRNFGISGEIGTQYTITRRFFTEIRFSKGITAQVDNFALEIYNGKRNTIRLGVGFKF